MFLIEKQLCALKERLPVKLKTYLGTWSVIDVRKDCVVVKRPGSTPRTMRISEGAWCDLLESAGLETQICGPEIGPITGGAEGPMIGCQFNLRPKRKSKQVRCYKPLKMRVLPYG